MTSADNMSTFSGDETISRVRTSGTDGEFVHIGHTKVRRDELFAAFGGELRPGLWKPPATRKLGGSPTPLGLMAFAVTTMMLSLVNAHARHLNNANIVYGVALFYGGAIQVIAGLLDLVIMENTFGGCALTSYGGFWISYAAIGMDVFGIQQSYTKEEYASAVGIFLVCWLIFTAFMTICTIRSTLAFFLLFFFLSVTFTLLASSEFTGNVGLQKAGGWTGIIVGVLGFYNAFAGLASKETNYFGIHAIPMPGAQHVPPHREPDPYADSEQQASSKVKSV